MQSLFEAATLEVLSPMARRSISMRDHRYGCIMSRDVATRVYTTVQFESRVYPGVCRVPVLHKNASDRDLPISETFVRTHVGRSCTSIGRHSSCSCANLVAAVLKYCLTCNRYV